jgi:hypothetical protein
MGSTLLLQFHLIACPRGCPRKTLPHPPHHTVPLEIGAAGFDVGQQNGRKSNSPAKTTSNSIIWRVHDARYRVLWTLVIEFSPGNSNGI